MTDYIVAGADLTAVANEIRSKGGTSAALEFPSEFISAIEAIEGGGGGGSTNILSGSTVPTSDIGEDGSLYLMTTPESVKNTSGQYINTGYSGNDNSKYVIDFMLTKAQTSKYPTPFGARSAANAVQNASYTHLGNNYNYTSGYVAWGTIQSTLSFGASAFVGKRATIELSKNMLSYTVDGQKTDIPISGTTVTNTTNVGIFAAIANGSVNSEMYMDGMMLFSFEIYENDALVHKFVPALDGSNVACVYDEVTQEYKYHSGSGTLEYAAESDAITAIYLKVNGSWQPLIGSDIDDVDTGGN